MGLFLNMSAVAVLCLGLASVTVGCGGGSTSSTGGNGGSSTTGGSGGQTMTGGGGQSTMTSGGAGSGGSTTTDTSCNYPSDDSVGYFTDAGPHGPFAPLPGELAKGASASCLGPWTIEKTFTGVSVVNTEGGITMLDVDVWLQPNDDITTLDIGEHEPAYQSMSVKSEKELGGLSYYVFNLPVTLVVPPGNAVCTAVPLTSLLPMSFSQGDCYEPHRTWWYGWTLQQGCGMDGATCQDGVSCTTGLPGICRTGVVTCNGNEAECVSLDAPAAEIADNGYDDNCNGIVDTDADPCTAESEVCGDGKDNNCNGIVDDPSPGKPSWAPLGLPGDPGVGIYEYDFAYGLVE